MWIRRTASEHNCAPPGRLNPAAPPFHPGPGRARAGRPVLLALAAALLAAWGPGYAQAPAAAPADAGLQDAQAEELIATIRANAVDRGEFTLLRLPGGDFWVAARDLERLKLEPRPQAQRRLGGETYYSLRALGATTLQFDEAALALRADFPADSIAGTVIDLSNRPPPVRPTEPGRSLILSYRLAARDAGRDIPSVVAFDQDANLRVGPILLRQETRLEFTGGERRFIRGVSQAVWDDRRTGDRIVVGDTLSSAGSFGSAITGAGVRLVKLYDIVPDVITRPTATLRAASALPAEVEVAVDGSPIYRTTVGPGPITLNNLMLHGGIRTVRVTVTDASGRREVIEQPVLFTESVLAAGLHEYSYFAGRRSELGPQGEWRYREAAWQASHRYGATDHLTVSAGGEGSPEFATVGAGVTLRSDTLGLFSLELLANRRRGADRLAHGWAARYSRVGPGASFVFGHRRFDDGFRTFLTRPDNPFLRSETRLGVSTRMWAATLAAEVSRTADALATRDLALLRLSTSLGRTTTLSAELQASRVNGQREWAGYIFIRSDLGGAHWAGATARATGNARGWDVDVGKQVPYGEGVGYRAGVSTSVQAGAESSYGFLAGSWNLRPATLEFFGTNTLRGPAARYAELAVSGALVGVDGYWGLTRRVDDGFVLARLGVPQAGVEVSLNNQVQGVTDAQGLVFIPQVGSFGRQDLSINDKQLGMQYDIAERRKTIAPAYRSGTVVDFGGRKLSAVAGMAWLLTGGQRTPIAARSWHLQGPAGAVTIETGSAGDFYLENAATGSYRGELQAGQRTATCRLTIPPFDEAVHELKEGIICE